MDNIVPIEGQAGVPVHAGGLVGVQTMSSREIAALTGKDHSNVCRDIRVMFEQLDDSNLNHLVERDNRGYVKQYNLPRRECEILVTGYDVRRRAAVIDRWLELETQNKPQLPSAKDLALMVIRAEEDKERALAQIEQDRPKVEFAESLKATTNNIDLTQCAKRLDVGPYKLREWLRDNHVLRSDNTPCERYKDGRFVVDTRVRRNSEGDKVSYSVTMVTPRGFVWLEKKVRECFK